MNLPYVLASASLALFLVLALVREVRLRRALQKLLIQILTLWRKRHAADPSLPAPPTAADEREQL